MKMCVLTKECWLEQGHTGGCLTAAGRLVEAMNQMTSDEATEVYEGAKVVIPFLGMNQDPVFVREAPGNVWMRCDPGDAEGYLHATKDLAGELQDAHHRIADLERDRYVLLSRLKPTDQTTSDSDSNDSATSPQVEQSEGSPYHTPRCECGKKHWPPCATPEPVKNSPENFNGASTVKAEPVERHRVCIGAEHDPESGKMHGCCVVCGEPWPCSTEKREHPEPVERTIGNGTVAVIEARADTHGLVVLRETGAPHPIGDVVEPNPGYPYVPEAGDVVVKILNREAGQVLVEQVQACLDKQWPEPVERGLALAYAEIRDLRSPRPTTSDLLTDVNSVEREPDGPWTIHEAALEAEAMEMYHGVAREQPERWPRWFQQRDGMTLHQFRERARVRYERVLARFGSPPPQAPGPIALIRDATAWEALEAEVRGLRARLDGSEFTDAQKVDGFRGLLQRIRKAESERDTAYAAGEAHGRKEAIREMRVWATAKGRQAVLDHLDYLDLTPEGGENDG